MSAPLDPHFRVWDFRRVGMLFGFALVLSVVLPLAAQEGGEGVEPLLEEKKADASPTNRPPTIHCGRATLVSQILNEVGCFFGPLLLILAIAQFLLIARLALSLRRDEAIPPNLVAELTALADDGAIREATLLARIHSSPLAEVMHAGLVRLEDGIDAARDGMWHRAEGIRARLDRPLTYLAIVGTLGPVIGFLGTLYAIYTSFQGMGQP
jgi:biopolymer transport protein ExbB